ncbi:MAG: cation-transporting P-type ATPase, partial [Desulfocapsaceae bacterium]|nr:cation-transporting P-type ATPase [Desulfocapsaceae bacterium]
MKSNPENNGKDIEKVAWHSLSADEVLETVSASSAGLSSEEAAQRLDQYGPNRLPAPPRRSPLIQFLSQFNNVLIYVLLFAALITALLADW